MSIFEAAARSTPPRRSRWSSWRARSRLRLVARLGGEGPRLLGVRAVIAESYERIHRSNLVGMGIVPLQFKPGETAASLGLPGKEIFETVGLPALLASGFSGGRSLTVLARAGNVVKEIPTVVRIDTPQEIGYYEHGGSWTTCSASWPVPPRTGPSDCIAGREPAGCAKKHDGGCWRQRPAPGRLQKRLAAIAGPTRARAR